ATYSEPTTFESCPPRAMSGAFICVLPRRKRMTIPFYSSSFAFAALIVSRETLINRLVVRVVGETM
ncbi:hypothetical protein, partial [Paraburkholderia dipogonis]|uniref:hypothetical protein n=1 Tax=Paraburkholderia dipogonis TaxID=1211383 RepID=UPI00362048CC